MPITPSDPFFWRHYESEIILLCVRSYLDLPLSYRQLLYADDAGHRSHAECMQTCLALAC